MKHGFLKRLACTALAAVTALSIAAIPAMAIDSLPDETSARSLTIYKYSGTSDYTAGGEGIMQDVDASTHEAIENVVYDIYYYANIGDNVPKSISADDAATWAASNASALKATIITDSTGKATWNAATGNSADGVYLVIERENAALESASAPFFISLPYTDPDEDSWIYNVVVQPKSAVNPGPEVNKDVTSIDNKDDSDMYNENQTWIIRGEVPSDLYSSEVINGQTTETYAKNYSFTDVIDSQLTYKGNVAVKVYVSAETALAESCYTATYDESTRTLTVALTEAGMKAVATAANGSEDAEVRVYFDTCINDTAVVGQDIYNNVELNYTNSTGHKYDPSEVPEDDRPEVHLGGFNILKVDVADTTKTLPGAVYKLAASEADAKAGTFMTDAEGNEITLTTDSYGKASYAGLTYPEGGSTEYYLVETQAPDGYQLATAPIKVTVNATTYSDSTKTYTLTDATKYDLPKAGGHGMMMWIILGMLIIGGTCVTAVATSTRRKTN